MDETRVEPAAPPKRSAGLTRGDLVAVLSPLPVEMFRAMLLDVCCDDANERRGG